MRTLVSMVAVSLQPVLGAAETTRLAGTRFTDVRWVAAVVVGMGLNVSSAPEGGAALGEGVDRAALLLAWLVGYDERLDHLDSLLDEYLARCVTVGRRVRVELPGRVVEATATGVDPA